jgi:MraZ protein
MTAANEFLLGEHPRSLDDRFRLSLPTELAEPLLASGAELILAKERQGCLSLWPAAAWQAKLDTGVELIKARIAAGRLDGRLGEVQLLGRLLSSRHKTVQIAGRSRLLIPEGFREFLQVEAGGDVVVVGAAVCVEIWQPAAWLQYLARRMPKFRRLFGKLAN